jgi:hypothetical protein
MGKETRSSAQKVETVLAISTHKKLKSKCKRENTTIAQVLRDAVQNFLKA